MRLQDLPAIPSPLEGGFYGGTVRIGQSLFAAVWAPKSGGETSGAWMPTNGLVQGTESCCDSKANTLAMAEAGSPLAKWALGLRLGGFDDWLIPARDVLELAYRHLKPSTYKTGGYFRDGDNPSSVPAGYPYKAAPVVQTPAPAFQKGATEAFEEDWYWTSSQYSESDAWIQIFDYGNQLNYAKKYEGRARAVRLIQLNA